MLTRKSAQVSPQTQALMRKVTTPIFPSLPLRVRPYLLAVTLFAAASALMLVGDAALLHYGFSWALVSLLFIVAAANLWGIRPAILVLTLSAVYGAAVVPHLGMSSPSQNPPPPHVLILRTILFVSCGTVSIGLTYRARQMQERAETSDRKAALAMQ